MDFNWNDVIPLFFLGAFPWITQLTKLEIHFESPNLNAKSIFNFFACLFSIAIFSYSIYVHPEQLIALPHWWWFTLSALILTFGYFAVFLYLREKVKNDNLKWPILVNFIIYIFIFCSLTTGFGLLKVYKDYILVEGRVISNTSMNGIVEAEITITDSEEEALKHIMTDKNGKFKLLLKKTDLPDCKGISVTCFSYKTFKKTVKTGSSIIYFLKEIKLVSEENE